MSGVTLVIVLKVLVLKIHLWFYMVQRVRVCVCVYYVGSVYWPLSSAHDKLSHVKLGIILDVQFKHGDELTGSLLFSASRVQLNKQTKKKSSGKMSQEEASVLSSLFFFTR